MGDYQAERCVERGEREPEGALKPERVQKRPAPEEGTLKPERVQRSGRTPGADYDAPAPPDRGADAPAG